MGLKLELVLIPVSDADRAKRFYVEQAGFDLLVDGGTGLPGQRIVQVTPPGSECRGQEGKGRRRPVIALPADVRALRRHAVDAETFTFLFTDIEGSTALLRRVGKSAYVQLLAEHHRLIRSVLAAHVGRELNTLGDGFFDVPSLDYAAPGSSASGYHAQVSTVHSAAAGLSRSAPRRIARAPELDGS